MQILLTIFAENYPKYFLSPCTSFKIFESWTNKSKFYKSYIALGCNTQTRVCTFLFKNACPVVITKLKVITLFKNCLWSTNHRFSCKSYTLKLKT